MHRIQMFQIYVVLLFSNDCRAPCQGILLLEISMHFYRPQRSCGNVIFLHLSVILFTGGMDPVDPGQTPLSQADPLW